MGAAQTTVCGVTYHRNFVREALRLTDWFAPKSAARIAQRGQSYAISPSQSTKSLLVNGTNVVGQQILKNGDQIEVAGVQLTFYLLSESKPAAREDAYGY